MAFFNGSSSNTTTNNNDRQNNNSSNGNGMRPSSNSNGGQNQNRNLRRRRNPNQSSSNQTGNNSQNGNNQQNGRGYFNRRRGNNNQGRRSNRNFDGRNRTTANNQVYETASALNWGNTSSYNFRNDPSSSKLRIIPISGLEDVGTNCTVLEYENDIIIIDAGLGFAGENLPGVDGLVPNLAYLQDKKDRIRGLVITHGHTDHIGGLHHIIEGIGFPQIYSPRLAAELIREKSKETGLINNLKITEYDGDSSYYLGKFHLSHFKMTHTIPDNYGIVIDTPIGRVVTPSDYKFDLSPYKESPSDYAKLAKLGDEGVLVLLNESTNAKKRGWSAAETDIAKDLEDTIRDAKGRLLIGMFSTMVNRIRQVVELADKNGKKVAVLGRSLENVVKISHNLGYINVLNSVFVPFEQINNIPDDKLVIITTGSQGEPNAALMRMALDRHQKVKLKASDTVVFSSSKIPGNEGKIEDLINLITLHGCKVLVNDYLTLHASGHGNQDEHKLMLGMTKPKYLMPIHGDPSMLAALRDTAIGLGYSPENIIMCTNGSVLEIDQNGWQIVDKIDSTPLWVEGNRVGNFNPEIVAERKMLTDEGVILVSLSSVGSDSFGLSSLEVTSKGFFVQNDDEYFHRSLPKKIVEYVQGIPTANREKSSVQSGVSRLLENELQLQYEKRPVIVVTVH